MRSSASRCLKIVEKPEIGLDVEEPLPEKVLLLTRPDQARLDGETAGQTLLRYWRLLFHLRVHVAMCDKGVRNLLCEAPEGPSRQMAPDTFLRPTGGAGSGRWSLKRSAPCWSRRGFYCRLATTRPSYVEFAAVALELKRFAPGLLACYFPAIEDWPAIDEILAEDVDDAALLAATRLAGRPIRWKEWRVARGEGRVPRPIVPAPPLDNPSLTPLPPNRTPRLVRSTVPISPRAACRATPGDPSETAYRRLLRRAERAAAVGNVVRSAICRVKAQRLAPPELQAKTRAAVKKDVDRLVCRLQVALEIGEADRQAWHDCLETLADRARRGSGRPRPGCSTICRRSAWTTSGRSTPWTWWSGPGPGASARSSAGLPSQREVLMSKHLRSARRRLAVVRLSDGQREQLAGLLDDAVTRAEQRLRRAAAAADHGRLGRSGADAGEPAGEGRPAEADRGVAGSGRRAGIPGDGRSARRACRATTSSSPTPPIPEPSSKATSCSGPTAGWPARWTAFTAGASSTSAGCSGSARWPSAPGPAASSPATRRCLSAGPSWRCVLRITWSRWRRTPISISCTSAERAGAGAVAAGPDLRRRLPPRPLVGAQEQLSGSDQRRECACALDRRLAARRSRSSRAAPFRLALRFVVKPLIFTALSARSFPWSRRTAALRRWPRGLVFLGMNVLLNSRLGRNVEELLTDWIVISLAALRPADSEEPLLGGGRLLQVPPAKHRAAVVHGGRVAAFPQRRDAAFV